MARDLIVQAAGGPPFELFKFNFGSEGSVREWWSEPAEQLGLTLIAPIYEVGFYEGIRFTREHFDLLEKELDALSAHWLTLPIHGDLLVQLEGRAAMFREALAIARRKGAEITIA